jgi:hypothetical protein
MLKDILEPLDSLAKRLSGSNSDASPDEVQAVLTVCDKVIEELSSLLLEYQQLEELENQPGPSSRPLPIPRTSSIARDVDLVTECKNIKALRTLLRNRVLAISSLSRYEEFSTATTVLVFICPGVRYEQLGILYFNG